MGGNAKKGLNYYAQPLGKVRRACTNLANGTETKEMRAKARARSENATSRLHTVLKDFQIVQFLGQWAVLHKSADIIVARSLTLTDAVALVDHYSKRGVAI